MQLRSNRHAPRPPSRGERAKRYAIALAALACSWTTHGPALAHARPTPDAVAPLLRFTFDEQTAPAPNSGASGSSYAGDLAGGFSFVPLGSGFAVALDDGSSVTVQGDENTFDLAQGDFSIRFAGRVSPGTGSALRALVAKGRSDSRGFGLYLEPSTGRARLRIEGDEEASVSSSARIDDGAMHDILAVRSGSQLHLYVDGLLSQSASIPGGSGNPENSWRLTVGKGNSGGPHAQGFAGVVDLVAIYDRAVTPADLGPASSDCNANGLDDAVEIAAGAAPDCDGNGVIDSCDGGTVANDCNGNGICDTQELALGLVPDLNANGLPDDCESWTALPHGIDSLIVFGDSLSDTGNFYAHTGQMSPPSPPYSQGRFSNGPMWVDYLRGYLGLDSAQVRNYAVGGATSSAHNVSSPTASGLTQELALFAQEVSAGFTPSPNALFTLWIGGNDFGANRQLVPTVPDAMANIENALRQLVLRGAQRILVPNLPDLGGTPVIQDELDPDVIVAARVGTIGFNANLHALLGRLERELGVDLILFDAFDLFEQIVADPPAFGFTDTHGACYESTTGAVCSNPDTHVFWDFIHPSTTAHRRIALGASTALVDGGAPLPGPLLATRGTVSITAPAHGSFTTDSFVTVTGRVSLRGLQHTTTASNPAPIALLELNGIPTDFDADGSYSAQVPLDLSRVEQPIVATLRRGEEVLDRERIVVFHGPSIGSTTTVADAVVARVTTDGLGVLNDHLMGTLLANNQLNLHTHLSGMNPISFNYDGCVQYQLDETAAGYLCSSLELTPLPGRVLVQFALHDLWVDYDVDTWFDCAPDPGIGCNGTITASHVSVWTEFAFAPGPGAGTIEVTQLYPLEKSLGLLGFQHSGPCADLAAFADLIPRINIDVESMVYAAISSALDELDEENVLEAKLEEVLNGISISGPLSDGLGAAVSGDLNAITFQHEGLQVELDARISPASSTTQRTFAVPAVAVGDLPQFGLDPESGAPYQIAISIALKSINQLLLARPDVLPQDLRISSIDVGAGLEPITARILTALSPAFGVLPATLPLEIRAQATLPPMLFGEPSSSTALSDVYLGALVVSIVEAASPAGANPLLSVSLDLRGDLSLGFHAPSASLEVALGIAVESQATTILANPLQADEESFELLTTSLAAMLLPEVGSTPMRFQLPELEGLDLAITNVSNGGGYATAVLELSSTHRRPDLIVDVIDPIGTVDVNAPFTITGRIKNVGSYVALGGAFVGASVSPDSEFMNGNDLGIGQNWLSFGSGIQPGGSRSFSLAVNPIGGTPGTPRTIFVLADVPQFLGGTGWLCERTETNNHKGEPIFADAADAFVVSLTPPTNLVGGVGPRNYSVRVGRSTVGPANLDVPVGVAVGAGPGGTYAQTWVTLSPGEIRDVTVSVPTPASYGSAGQSNPFTVTACTNLQPDANGANNCQQANVSIAVPWWDLRFSIVNDPSSAEIGHSTGWSVRVTNAGNVLSAPRCAITGIQLYPGPGNWGAGAGIIVNFGTPSIAPGASWTFPVSGYFVNGGAILGTQYIKAEIHYSNGCTDIYGAGNYDQEAITITN